MLSVRAAASELFLHAVGWAVCGVISVHLVDGVSRPDHSLPVKGGCVDAHQAASCASDLRKHENHPKQISLWIGLLRSFVEKGEITCCLHSRAPTITTQGERPPRTPPEMQTP